jgi:cell surface protein SprA
MFSNYPIILTPKQYESLVLKESMRDYFKKRPMLSTVKKRVVRLLRKICYQILRKFKPFESIFGSNTIDVKPTGSVEMDLGARFTKQDNPSFSPRNRSIYRLTLIKG